MSREIYIICAVILLFKCSSAAHLAKIAPEDVSAGLTVIYGFAPRLKLENYPIPYMDIGLLDTDMYIPIGNDHRVGFGFRFGNHADFQILYEFGPQTVTTPVQATTTKTRSVPYRSSYVRKPRRRPFIELLLRTGLLREVTRVEKHLHKKVSNSAQVKT